VKDRRPDSKPRRSRPADESPTNNTEARGPQRAFRGRLTRASGHHGSKLQRFADHNRNNLTSSEWRFEKILLTIGAGRLKGRFHSQHAISGKWIIDFFIPEVRLGIEIDGNSHTRPRQQELDRQKDRDALAVQITLIRFTNDEVWGDQHKLVDRLRDGWRRAKLKLEAANRDDREARAARQALRSFHKRS
jgi:very-short-patch-repair endonuclease